MVKYTTMPALNTSALFKNNEFIMSSIEQKEKTIEDVFGKPSLISIDEFKDKAFNLKTKTQGHVKVLNILSKALGYKNYQHLSASFDKIDVTNIFIGPSGSGKTKLINTILDAHAPNEAYLKYKIQLGLSEFNKKRDTIISSGEVKMIAIEESWMIKEEFSQTIKKLLTTDITAYYTFQSYNDISEDSMRLLESASPHVKYTLFRKI